MIFCVCDNEKMTFIHLTVVSTLMLKYATLTIDGSSGNGTMLTVGAYHSVMGSICMLISTEYHSNHWDIVPKHPVDLVIYKTNRRGVHKGFRLSESIYDVENDAVEIN